jgi:hypothetical protein
VKRDPDYADEQYPNAATNPHRLVFTVTPTRSRTKTGAYCAAPECTWGQKFVQGWRITQARQQFDLHLHELAPKLGDTRHLPFLRAVE